MESNRVLQNDVQRYFAGTVIKILDDGNEIKMFTLAHGWNILKTPTIGNNYIPRDKKDRSIRYLVNGGCDYIVTASTTELRFTC